MIIKKYVASNMKEALNKIGKELGKDAVIISQRAIRKPGIKGLFSPKVVEITVAVESRPIDYKNLKDDSEFTNSSNSVITKEEQSLKKEVEDMKNILNAYLAPNNSSKTEVITKGEELNVTVVKEDSENKENSDYLSDFIEKLRELDISKDISREIIEEIKADGDNGNTKEEINKRIKGALGRIIKTDASELKGAIALIGPTGVGKTTTIAKIAGDLALVKKKKVGLITIDTYRIGAVEQLKTYADIMNIRFKVVFSHNEMEDAISSMKDCDVILLDTTGRSSKNTMQVLELKAFIERAKVNDTYLVISTTTKSRDIDIIASGFESIEYNGLILTKLDETSTYGSIVNICKATKAPIKYITTGQNVPDDIIVPKSEELVKLVLGENSVC